MDGPPWPRRSRPPSSDVNAKIVADHNFQLAMQPKVKLPDRARTTVEQVIAGKSDLSYTVAMEILAQIELADFKTITLDKLAGGGRRMPRSTRD